MSEPEKPKKKKTKKPQKVKARLPRGFVDRDAGDIRALEEMTGQDPRGL